jgi:tetratricopeptide (TPR) repeat protein
VNIELASGSRHVTAIGRQGGGGVSLLPVRLLCLIGSAKRGVEPRLREDTAAIKQHERALELRRGRLGPDHPNTLTSMNNLASAYRRNGDFAKAERILRQCLTLRQQKQPEAWATFSTQSQLDASLLGQKRYAEAEPLLLAGYEGMKQCQATIPAYYKNLLTESLERLVQLYDA